MAQLPGAQFTMNNVNSLDELNESNDNTVYYHDITTGWLHLKVTQLEDRRIGGEFTDSDGNTWTVADSPNIIFGLGADLEVNYPSVWAFNMPNGQHFVHVQVKGSDYGQHDVQVNC